MNSTAKSLSQTVTKLEQIQTRTLQELTRTHEESLKVALELLENLLPNLEQLDSPIASLEEISDARTKFRHGFLQPLVKYFGRQRHRRMSASLETFYRERDELLWELPDVWQGRGADFLMLFDEGSGHFSGSARWSRPRQLRLRAAAAGYLAAHEQTRLICEDRLVMGLVHTFRALLVAWEVAVTSRALPQYAKVVDTLIRQSMDSVKDNLLHWAAQNNKELAGFTKALLKKPRTPRSARSKHQLAQGSVLRSLEADLVLQEEIERFWDSSVESLLKLRRRLSRELESLKSDRDTMVAFVEGVEEEEVCGKPPAGRVKILPFRSQTDTVFEEFDEQTPKIPDTLSVVRFKRFKSPPKVHRFNLSPLVCMIKALADNREDLEWRIKKVVEVHLALFQEIERARDVITYAREVVHGEGDGSDDGAIRDATANATRLLALYSDQRLDATSLAGGTWTQWLDQVFLEYRERLGRDRMDFLKFLVSSRGRQSQRTLLRVAGRGVKESRRRFRVWLTTTSRRFLVGIGWQGEERSVLTAPTRRALLPEEYLKVNSTALPAIYQRLFKVEPLDDTRFMVGRSDEMEAIREAYSLWQNQRAAAILITGQRGSGKTSLLNCAESEIFTSHPVLRLEAVDRILTKDQLDQFLRRALDVPADRPMLEALEEFGGVLVLEEVERLFLRKIGGYDAMTALIDLIGMTQNLCLWVLALNEVSLRLLERVFQLSSSFSHRIRTSGVSPPDVQEAILLRHNLSGFSLQFDAPPVMDKKISGRLSKWRRWSESDSSALFFRKLSENSAGVFRTALELWHGHIRLFEGGVVFMHAFHEVDSSPLMVELGQDDLFFLVAILQHGSLTPEEVAEVFEIPLVAARTAIDELWGRELIHTEPTRPGFRVTPEALPLVKEALYRKNLL